MSVLESFKQLKAEGTKIVVVTSHEYWSAKILNDTDINGILIGDDLNMVVHGHEDTLSCDVETRAMNPRAGKKGAQQKFVKAGMTMRGTRKGF
jgi:3-methyl-2-oxobutanoate hydroxymethyltransferase